MLPQSYDHVSEETKQTVQLFIARASGYLQGKGHCDEEVEVTMNKVKERANREALEMALDAWKRNRQPCTAERFVQWFADLLWDAVTSEDDQLWPYQFTAPVSEGRLSTEFLDAITRMKAEAEARRGPQAKKEKMPENEQSVDTQQIPGKPQSPGRQPPIAKETPAKRETPDEKQVTSKEQVISAKQGKPLKEAKPLFHLTPDLEEPATLQAAIFNRLDAEVDYAAAKRALMSKKRKNGEPEPVAPKRQRRHLGETFPSGSFTELSNEFQWSGIPLADHEFKLMNAGLMEAIWESLIYQGDHIYHNAGVFAVKIQKDKAWFLLGKEIRKVFRLVGRRWYPFRLYTCDLGRYLQVGLWVEKIHSQGQMVQEVRCKSEELYHILWHWAVQAECGGVQSLASLLQAYLRELGIR